ncbi:BlaI/MecI/CopY family transcriptional regulator [Aminipila luticellarii]|uniref:BlaI/MecI/CopY family transcriptional regulator n=1 Tax=Aminipila luticellarii TaxID=2507160 RepID=A0A410PWP1_9FIRM|nr:BlaI/MecI/CopY family transcriptional regulator [Aminipila luticellarii]QAT43359.1 BlaI/MecI/CopY family transcriptional regulator [Aminipila luticellarii]
MRNSSMSISDSEWKIMKILWDSPHITLKEIAGKAGGSGWSYTTVRTLVNRLAEKGAIAADKSAANTFRYYPVAVEEECQMKEVKSLLRKVFDGSASMLVSALAKDSDLSEREREELRSIIDKMDK